MKRSIFFKTYSKVFHILPQHFRKRFWWMQVLILITSIIDLAGLAVFIPVLTAVANPGILSGDGVLAHLKKWMGIDDNNRFLLVLFLGALLFLIIRIFFIVFSQKLQNKFVFQLSEYVSEKTYRFYFAAKYEDFTGIDAAKIIRELTVSPQHFARFLVLPLLLISSELLVIILIVLGIAAYNMQVFLLLIVTIFPAAFLFQTIIKKSLRKYGKIQHENTPKLYAHSNRGIQGFIDVKLRNKEDAIIKDYLSIFRILNRVSIKTAVLSIIPTKLFELITIFGLFMIFIYATYWSSNSSMVLSLIAIYAAAGYRVIPSLSKIMPSLMQLEQYGYLFEVYGEILKVDQLPFHENRDNKATPVKFDHTISLKDVSFKFKRDTNPLFSGINLQIKKGEVIGLIGRSGSGKTTLVNLLTGFHAPSSGNIFIDDERLISGNVASWRSQISYVLQSPYLEKGSLASNIAFLEKEINKAKMDEAIRAACLQELLGGKDPEDLFIDEGGKNLSGGQKQRVVIARALYHQSKLIVLDEATSALDNETEDAINTTIENLKGSGITILIIAHRYSSLKHTDRIIKMKSGRIERELSYSDIHK